MPTIPAPCPRLHSATFHDVVCDARSGLGRLPPHVTPIASQASAVLDKRVETDALHAAALVDLVSDDTTRNRLDRSISFLEMVTQLNPRAAAVRADLSAAYLRRAAERADSRDLLLAIDAAGQALELDPTNDAAEFNRALALDLLGVDGEARKGWRALVARDSTSVWAEEARRRPSADSTPRPSVPTTDATSAELAAFAVARPGMARAFAWDSLLAGWGDAFVSGDSARAAARLRAASVIGRTLATRFADSVIADAVRSIERMVPRRDLRELASAHVDFARARDRDRSNAFPAADSAFTAALASKSSPALRRWATLGHGNTQIYLGHPDRAEQVIETLTRQQEARGDAALSARVLSTLGVLHLRRGRTDAGLGFIRAARTLFERVGEREYSGAMIGIEGEVALQGGDAMSGYAGLHRALLELRDYPESVMRHNVLFLLARGAATDGLTAAAAAIEEEDATVVAAGGLPESVAEGRLGRARAQWGAGHHAEARSSLESASRIIDSLPPGETRDRFRAELGFAMASGPLRSQPARARALLDSVVAHFARLRNPVKLIPALVARAEANLSLGRVAGAEADLDSAAALHDPHRREVAAMPQRALLLAQARSVFDALVMIRLKTGRTAAALDALERRRLSFSVMGQAGGRGEESGAPTDSAATVDYALVGDTLLAWVVTRADTTFERTSIDREQLTAVVNRTRAALELDLPEAVIRKDLAWLYETLIRRIAPRVAGRQRVLTIVADDEIADIPFAALYDARQREYLVERHALRFAPTLREALSVRRAPSVPKAALVVANPTLDRRKFPGLSALPHAESEARAVARAYDRTTSIFGATADSATVVSALRSAELFHFAGHAVFDDRRPDRSFLAVSPRGLDSRAISTLDLRRLRLAVLSACETTRSATRRSSGFFGLTESFLAAGAGGVVGSLWRVADTQTDSLMRSFHWKYRRSGDAVTSLRHAQITLKEAGFPPSAWAAFRYAGR